MTEGNFKRSLLCLISIISNQGNFSRRGCFNFRRLNVFFASLIMIMKDGKFTGKPVFDKITGELIGWSNNNKITKIDDLGK